MSSRQAEHSPIEKVAFSDLLKRNSRIDMDVEKESAQDVNHQSIHIKEERAKLDLFSGGQESIYDLNNKPLLRPVLELSKPNTFNPVFSFYSSILELQTGMERMLAEEKNPVLRFGLRVGIKLNQFSIILLADMLGLRDKKGEDDEEDEEKKKKENKLKQQKLTGLRGLTKYLIGEIGQDNQFPQEIKVVGGLK